MQLGDVTGKTRGGANLAEAERALRIADGSAFLVLPRVLRRVVRTDRELPALTFQVPHRKSYTIPTERLLWIVEPDELGVPSATELPDVAILLAYPDEQELAEMSSSELLGELWRLLFHARVHRAFETLLAEGRLTPAGIRERIDRIGQTEFDEVQAVLQREQFLFPEASPTDVYVEFAAVYLELRYFAPHWVRSYFPSLDDLTRIDLILAEDVDAAELFVASRLEGAPDPECEEGLCDDRELTDPDEVPELRDIPATRASQLLLQKAERAAAQGNGVLAAVLATRVAESGSQELAVRARRAAATELDRLTKRLQAALGFNDAAAREWRDVLGALLANAAHGFWRADRRMLYDLQKVCVDHERGVFVVDLFEWCRSLGHRPLKRPLPNQREVLVSKHLRTASRRLSSARLAGPHRVRLAELLQAATHAADERVRTRLRPLINWGLDEVGLLPKNVPEKVARNKLVEELLDGILQRDYLTMGHLRDAISRNNLKLSDLSGVREFFVGDPLLRADRKLATLLDGVYRKGEFYLRGLQRLSSLAFGTPWGRFATKYLMIPFGGAYLAAEGLQHLLGIVTHLLGQHEPHIMGPWSVLPLGIFLLGVLYWPAFRRATVRTLKAGYQLVRGVFIDFPNWLTRLTVVQQILRSPPVLFARRYLLTPTLLTAVLWFVWPFLGATDRPDVSGTGLLFLLLTLIVNSRLGRDIEEVTSEWVERIWRRIRVRIFVALFELIMETFKRMLEGLERLLYAVDEWLRFKSGETGLTLGVKAVLGAIWGIVTYVIRFCVTLLVEPQINPIKHFPVVTVSHKILLPTAPLLARLLTPTFGKVWANTIAGTTIMVLPGVFGFLVWELKENWRLYAANRSKKLRPVIVGDHGETFVRLMKPGFHSGVLPKLFEKLRRAERNRNPSRRRRSRTRYSGKLLHVEEAIRHFIEREFIALLRLSQVCGELEVRVGRIEMGSNIVRVELNCADLGTAPLWLAFQEQSRLLVASILSTGWLIHLNEAQGAAMRNALAGLYKAAGVDLVREQIEACFEPRTLAYDIRENELIVWPDGRYEVEVFYSLQEQPLIEPRPEEAARAYHLPFLRAPRIIFAHNDLEWEAWVAAWDAETAEAGPPAVLPEELKLLPSTERVPIANL